MTPRHILFICSQNRLRSPTAEEVFADWPGIEVASAGIDTTAIVPVSPELLEWSDTIFVMEKSHRNKLSTRFKKHLKSQRIVVLNIPDDYEFMAPRLIERLQALVPRFLM